VDGIFVAEVAYGTYRVEHKEGFGTLVASVAVRVKKCFVVKQCRDHLSSEILELVV
jgi:hypothetical protein